jgi:hypothetical protein
MNRTIARGVLTAITAMASTVAGCGSTPSCEQAVKHAAALRNLDDLEILNGTERCKRDGWSSEVRACIAGAASTEALDRCAARSRRGRGGDDGADPFTSYMQKAKKTEAELRLRQLEKALKIEYATNAAFPVGDTGPTPAAGACCRGPNHKCAPDPALWQGDPVWQQLDFEVDEPGYYSFAYHGQGDGQAATAEAIGDLDCDDAMAVYTLRCEAVAGNPRCELTPPPRPD